MRLPPIRYGVDIELPLAPCNGVPAATDTRLAGRFARRAVAAAALAAAAGCATHDAELSRQFRIEPVYSVSNAPQSTASSQAYFTLGKYFDEMHEWGRAVDAYRQAVAADTANVEAVNALGVALAQGRHFAEAEATLRRAVDLAPERIHIRNNLGYLLLVEGRPQDAAAQLKVAVSQDPGNAIALANLRNATAQMGIADAAAPAPVPSQVTQARTAAPEMTAAQTIATGTATAAATAMPTPAPMAVAPAAALPPETGTPAALRIARLEVSNGNGVNGMAAQLGLWLAARGVATQRLTNQQPYDQRWTVIQFRSGQDEAARRLASLLPASAQTAARPSPGLVSDVRVVLGQDWRSVADCLAHSSCRTTSVAVARIDSPTNQ
jgi:tetratricopeptide (TPR) repeat protein